MKKSIDLTELLVGMFLIIGFWVFLTALAHGQTISTTPPCPRVIKWDEVASQFCVSGPREVYPWIEVRDETGLKRVRINLASGIVMFQSCTPEQGAEIFRQALKNERTITSPKIAIK